MAKSTKKAPANVRVSVLVKIGGRADEILLTVSVPTVGEGSLPANPKAADLIAKVAELVQPQVKIRPAKGEAARALKVIKAARS